MRMKSKLIVILVIATIVASCRSVKYVPVETVRTDTTYITKEQRDSIHIHDSIYVHEHQKGDTVFVEVEKIKRIYIDKTTHDTTYVATHDSIPVPYPVEKELKFRQKVAIKYFPLALFLCFGLLVWTFRKPILKLIRKLWVR